VKNCFYIGEDALLSSWLIMSYWFLYFSFNCFWWWKNIDRHNSFKSCHAHTSIHTFTLTIKEKEIWQ